MMWTPIKLLQRLSNEFKTEYCPTCSIFKILWHMDKEWEIEVFVITYKMPLEGLVQPTVTYINFIENCGAIINKDANMRK